MPKIRVLVVDDAVVFRRLVSEELNNDPALEVVGTASNGKIALARIPQVNPDIVILDIEMPEMDGLATLKELRKTWPRLPVIMFSALTERGAAATLDALALGATDYFTKPTTVGCLDASLEVLRSQLIPEIKALCQPKSAPAKPACRSTPDPKATRHSSTASDVCQRVDQRLFDTKAGPVQVLAIGSSTGGPNALAEIFSKLPADLPVPIVMVQHMPPMFTRLLAERLTHQFCIPVQEGASGGKLEPGQAYIAPGDHHMIVVREGTQYRLLLHQDPPENSCRPAVDVLFRSVAKCFGGNSLSVVLTGMGQDGLRGCEVLREAGGQIVVQDEATSVVWGMPGHVARAGLADKVLPIEAIGLEIVRRLKQRC